MNSKEWFGLFLRIVGVLGILTITRHALVPHLAQTYPHPGLQIIKWVIGVVVGVYLIRGAPGLVKFAYPDKPAP